MSATAGQRVPRPMRAPRRAPRPSLHVVTARVERASGGAFVAFCLLLLGAGLVAVLVVNTSLAKGAFELRDLQRQDSVLSDRVTTLQQSIDSESSPTLLARRAAAMGMVPAQGAAFLRLSDGRVLGVAEPAVPVKGFSVITSPVPVKPPATPKPATTPRGTPTGTPTTTPTGKPTTVKPGTKPTKPKPTATP